MCSLTRCLIISLRLSTSLSQNGCACGSHLPVLHRKVLSLVKIFLLICEEKLDEIHLHVTGQAMSLLPLWIFRFSKQKPRTSWLGTDVDWLYRQSMLGLHTLYNYPRTYLKHFGFPTLKSPQISFSLFLISTYNYGGKVQLIIIIWWFYSRFILAHFNYLCGFRFINLSCIHLLMDTKGGSITRLLWFHRYKHWYACITVEC